MRNFIFFIFFKSFGNFGFLRKKDFGEKNLKKIAKSWPKTGVWGGLMTLILLDFCVFLGFLLKFSAFY